MRRLVILAICFAALSGCGYRVVNGNGGGAPRTVEVTIFENRTMKANVEALVAEGLAAELSERGEWRLQDGGDYVIKGTIVSYAAPPASFSPRDRIREHRAEMAVEVFFVEKQTERILWKRLFSLQQGYPTDDRYTRQENNEEAAIRYMAESLAREVRVSLLEELPEGS